MSKKDLPLEEIKSLYLRENFGVRKIAKQFNVAPSTIAGRLYRMGVYRTVSEAQKLAVKLGRKHACVGGRREQNPSWKGGKGRREGYIIVWAPEHHRANGGYVYEHILVWEQGHKVKLPATWVIHHVNGVKTDNRPDNLVAYPRLKHDKLIPILLNRIKSLELENKALRARQMPLPAKSRPELEVM